MTIKEKINVMLEEARLHKEFSSSSSSSEARRFWSGYIGALEELKLFIKYQDESKNTE